MRVNNKKQFMYRDFLEEELKFRKKQKASSDFYRISREFRLFVRYYDDPELQDDNSLYMIDKESRSKKKEEKNLVVCDSEGTFVDYVLVEDEEILSRKIGMEIRFTEIIVEEHQILLELVPETHVLRIGHHIKQFRIDHESNPPEAGSIISNMQNIAVDPKNEETLTRIRKYLISQTGTNLTDLPQIRNNMITYIKDSSKKKLISFKTKKSNTIPILRQNETQEMLSQDMSSVSHSSIHRDPRLMASKITSKFNFQASQQSKQGGYANQNTFGVPKNKKNLKVQQKQGQIYNRQNEESNRSEISELMSLLDQSEQQRKGQQENQIQEELNSSFFKRLQRNQKNRILEKRFTGQLPNGIFQGDRKNNNRNTQGQQRFGKQFNKNQIDGVQPANQFGEKQNQFISQNGVILIDNQRQVNLKRKKALVNRAYVIILNEDLDPQVLISQRKQHKSNPTSNPTNNPQHRINIPSTMEENASKLEQSSYQSNSFVPKKEVNG